MSKKRYNTPSRGNNASVRITAIIALFLAFAVGAYVVLSLVFHSWNPVRWTGTNQNQADGSNDDKDPSDDKLVNSGENKGILLKSAPISSEQFEDYGIDAQASTAYSITATVNEDAADKSVIGSVSWKNGSSAWATGKSINDYVTLNQTTQYGLNFTLTVKQAFGETVMVKVASCMDSGIYGTAQVDHLKELQSFTAVINPSYGSDIGRINVGDNINTIQITPNFGVGTVEGTISNYKTTFTTNNFFRTELKKRLDNFTSSMGGTFSPLQKIQTTGKDFKIPLSNLYAGGGPPPTTIVNNFIKEFGAAGIIGTEAVIAGVTRIEYELTYSYGDEYKVVKTYRNEHPDDISKDEPTRLYAAFRNDNLTMISSIDNIQVAPDNIVVLPVANALLSLPAATFKSL